MALTTEQACLLALQEIDKGLASLDERLATTGYKKRIAVSRAKLTEGEKRLSGLLLAGSQLDERISVLAEEIDELTDRLSAEQKKLHASSDHREVSALSRELETIVKAREKRENETLGLMEKRASYGEARLDTEEKMNRLREVETGELVAYKEFCQKVSEAKRELLSGREEVVGRLPEELLSRYEKVRAEKKGIAVTRYRSGKCEGCSVIIPLSARATIENSERIDTCPTCKRLLIVEQE